MKLYNLLRGQKVKPWWRAEDSLMSDVVQTAQWDTSSVLLMLFSPIVTTQESISKVLRGMKQHHKLIIILIIIHFYRLFF